MLSMTGQDPMDLLTDEQVEKVLVQTFNVTILATKKRLLKKNFVSVKSEVSDVHLILSVCFYL